MCILSKIGIKTTKDKSELTYNNSDENKKQNDDKTLKVDKSTSDDDLLAMYFSGVFK